MRVAVTGSGGRVEHLAGVLTGQGHKVMLIDKDRAFCERVCGVCAAQATLGDPCQEDILREADIRNYDVLMALGRKDTDNFEICQMGRKVFGIKKTVCLVENPRNVEVFQQLGIDQVVNVPLLLAGMI